jgi:hypothetical protein
MSDIYYLLVGMAIGIFMRMFVALVDAAIEAIEQDVSR